jgi:16S rRNA (guanine527-N7)-methyltransferase
VKHSLAEPLARYRALVEKYHATLDLMSSAALEDFAAKVEDALAYARTVEETGSPHPRILDLGSGVGLPGIVLALALPGAEVTLVERRRRRSAFLRLALADLGLRNARSVAGDVRDVQLAPVDVVTAQAVGSLDRLYCLSRHLHAAEILLMSRKGADWRAEVAALEATVGVTARAWESAQLSQHGRLVAVRLSGGLSCPSSG